MEEMPAVCDHSRAHFLSEKTSLIRQLSVAAEQTYNSHFIISWIITHHFMVNYYSQLNMNTVKSDTQFSFIVYTVFVSVKGRRRTI